MDCYGIIDLETKKSTLFVPRYDDYYQIWMTLLSLDDFKTKYSTIDDVLYVEDIEKYFKERAPKKVYLNLGKNTDSGHITQIPSEDLFKGVCPDAVVDTKYVHDILAEARAYKHDEEIEIMKWATKITCEAHCNVMR